MDKWRLKKFQEEIISLKSSFGLTCKEDHIYYLCEYQPKRLAASGKLPKYDEIRDIILFK